MNRVLRTLPLAAIVIVQVMSGAALADERSEPPVDAWAQASVNDEAASLDGWAQASVNDEAPNSDGWAYNVPAEAPPVEVVAVGEGSRPVQTTSTGTGITDEVILALLMLGTGLLIGGAGIYSLDHRSGPSPIH